MCEISRSTDSTAKSISLSLCIVDLRYVSIHFKAENDLWQDAELTQIVSAICRNLSKVEKASFSGWKSLKTSLILSIVFLANVPASIDSIFRDTV